MGYFPNGTSGEQYEAQYCLRCRRHNPESGCLIMVLHLIHNYAECNKPDSMLHELIPRDGVHNGQCVGFWEVL